MTFIWPKWNRAILKIALAAALLLGAECSPSMQGAPGGLRWRFLRKSGDAEACGESAIFQVVLRPLNKNGSSATDTLVTVEGSGSFYGADWRRLLSLLAPGDSVLVEMPADSVTFMRAFLEPFADHDMVRMSLVVRECEEAEKFFEARERLNEALRLQAYLQFDSLVRKCTQGRVVGRGALIAWSREGKGRYLRFGDSLRLSLRITTLNGEHLYQSPSGGDSLEVYDGSFIPGLHEALTGLKAGDTACVFLPYFLAYGEEGIAPYVKPFQNVCVYVRVHPKRLSKIR